MVKVKEKTIDLEAYLQAETKEGLHDIRRELGVPGASQLNKAELVQRLYTHMLDHLEEHVLRMDRTRYELLKKAMRAKGGRLPETEWVNDQYGEPFYYQLYGMLFFEGNVLVMPEEIREKLSSLDEQRLLPVLDRNTEWVKLTQGMLYYYGIASIEKIKEKLEHYTGQAVNLKELRQVLLELEPYDYSVLFTPFGFTHFTVTDPQDIYSEQQSRPDVDYYPLTKAQALQASAENFDDRHEGYRRLVTFLRKHGSMDASEADALTGDLMERIQWGVSFNELFSSIQEELEFTSEKQFNELAGILQQMMNNTRLWVLKGHTPEEVFAKEREHLQPLPSSSVQFPLASPPAVSSMNHNVYSFETKQKIGRNDPCPCGSGKKYKKCCGG